MALPDIETVFLHQSEEVPVKKKEENKTKTALPKKKYTCTYPGCKAKFTRPSKLDRHYCMHTGERRYVCDFENCDKAYTNISYLKRHKLTHNEVKETFPCNICNMTFTIQHNLKRHCKRWHENPLRLYHLPKVCEVCKEEFPRRYLLLAHMKETHNRLLYKCELCEKSFSEPMKLRRHVNSTVHQKFFCTICTTAFGSQEELKEHKATHFPFPEYKCDICDKKYISKRNLRTHVSDHMKSTIIMCSYEGCNRIYYFQRNLDQHIRTFHMGEKWTCPSCPAQLASKQKLRIHIDKIHLNPTPRKPPPTNGNRKRRWDAHMPKKSAVSQLLGLQLPIRAEKDIINRLENHLELK